MSFPDVGLARTMIRNFREARRDRSCHTLPDPAGEAGIPWIGVREAMKIKLTSIIVDNQDKALEFYTEVLGFVKSKDIPVGEFKWLTVVSPEGHPDVELSLEPNANPAAKTFQEALFRQGIPLTAFEVTDIQKESSGSRPTAWYLVGNPRKQARSLWPYSPTLAET